MLSTALKADQQIIEYAPRWLPDSWVWRNFPDAFTFVPFDIYLRNTFLIAILICPGCPNLLNLTSLRFCSYGLAGPGCRLHCSHQYVDVTFRSNTGAALCRI